ncbi:FIGNL1-interacting regulator of recombination and mitosis-like [Rhynchonycteris naso]
MLAVWQQLSSRCGEPRHAAGSCSLKALASESSPPRPRQSQLSPAACGPGLRKTVKLFDDMMCELTSQGRELSSQNLEIQTSLRNILQTMVQVLGALTGCVQHICATQASIVLENIPSLPASVLHVVRSTFVHCKD